MKGNILSPAQISLLEELGRNNFITQAFYLSGGTALAGFYLYHRYSEDLDFFSENEFDILQIDVSLRELQKKLQIGKIDFQQSYNRNLFFLHLKDEVVKLEFTYYPFPRIEKGKREYNIQIDSLLDIAVNKLFSVYQRTTARDYIDLYLICKEKGYSVKDIIKKAKEKFDWHIDLLQLGTQFVKAEEAKDYPRMIVNIEPKEWQEFFRTEAKKFRKEIVD